MYFRFGRSNHLSGIHSNSLSMRILKKKQTITVQYGLETASSIQDLEVNSRPYQLSTLLLRNRIKQRFFFSIDIEIKEEQ